MREITGMKRMEVYVHSTNSTHKMMKGCNTLFEGGLWVIFENSNFIKM
jgi:hypothetical protein